MRLLFLLLGLPFIATFAPPSLFREPAEPQHPVVVAEPVALRDEAPSAKRLGRLTFIEGWRLRSDHPHFGGISAMHVTGREVLALNDGGVLIRFVLPLRGGRAPLRIEDLPDAPGSTKKQRDSEAMTVHGNRAWIAFERVNAVSRHDLGTWRRQASARPRGMRRWPLNSGSEAMARLRDGRFLIFSEGAERPDGSTGALLFEGDPALTSTRWARLGYRAPEGYRITDAAQLPDGRLIFLNRRVSLLDGFLVKMTIAPLPELKEGTVISGTEIALFKPPVTTDNYEAISAAQENGRTVVWIASDDNFMGIQRTLLMKFTLDG